MKNSIPKEWIYIIRFTVLAFCVGSAFQLGISIASDLKPRIEVIEIREAIEINKTDNPSAIGFVHRFNF